MASQYFFVIFSLYWHFHFYIIDFFDRLVSYWLERHTLLILAVIITISFSSIDYWIFSPLSLVIFDIGRHFHYLLSSSFFPCRHYAFIPFVVIRKICCTTTRRWACAGVTAMLSYALLTPGSRLLKCRHGSHSGIQRAASANARW